MELDLLHDRPKDTRTEGNLSTEWLDFIALVCFNLYDILTTVFPVTSKKKG